MDAYESLRKQTAAKRDNTGLSQCPISSLRECEIEPFAARETQSAAGWAMPAAPIYNRRLVSNQPAQPMLQAEAGTVIQAVKVSI